MKIVNAILVKNKDKINEPRLHAEVRQQAKFLGRTENWST